MDVTMERDSVCMGSRNGTAGVRRSERSVQSGSPGAAIRKL